MSIVKYFTVIEFVAETYRRKTLRGNCAMREIGPTWTYFWNLLFLINY